MGKADPGRVEGARKVLASRFNLLGPYSDDATREAAAATRQLVVDKQSAGEFKVPSLRNLVLTGPYGRDGSIDTLAEVVRHYSEIDPRRLHAKDGKRGTPLELSASEQADLVVFLESLSTFATAGGPMRAARADSRALASAFASSVTFTPWPTTSAF